MKRVSVEKLIRFGICDILEILKKIRNWILDAEERKGKIQYTKRSELHKHAADVWPGIVTKRKKLNTSQGWKQRDWESGGSEGASLLSGRDASHWNNQTCMLLKGKKRCFRETPMPQGGGEKDVIDLQGLEKEFLILESIPRTGENNNYRR